MSRLARPLTYDDIIALPEDRKRHEIIGGKLYSSSTPPRDHQVVSAKLSRLVGNYAEEYRLGWCYFPRVDVRLSPHDVVVPDLLFVPRERGAIHMYRGDVQGAPALITEIMGPDTRAIDRGLKFDLYERSGVSEYWLVDYEAHRFQLFVLREGRYQASVGANGGVRSTAIPGLSFDPAVVFSELDHW